MESMEVDKYPCDSEFEMSIPVRPSPIGKNKTRIDPAPPVCQPSETESSMEVLPDTSVSSYTEDLPSTGALSFSVARPSRVQLFAGINSAMSNPIQFPEMEVIEPVYFRKMPVQRSSSPAPLMLDERRLVTEQTNTRYITRSITRRMEMMQIDTDPAVEHVPQRSSGVGPIPKLPRDPRLLRMPWRRQKTRPTQVQMVHSTPKIPKSHIVSQMVSRAKGEGRTPSPRIGISKLRSLPSEPRLTRSKSRLMKMTPSETVQERRSRQAAQSLSMQTQPATPKFNSADKRGKSVDRRPSSRSTPRSPEVKYVLAASPYSTKMLTDSPVPTPPQRRRIIKPTASPDFVYHPMKRSTNAMILSSTRLSAVSRSSHVTKATSKNVVRTTSIVKRMRTLATTIKRTFTRSSKSQSKSKESKPKSLDVTDYSNVQQASDVQWVELNSTKSANQSRPTVDGTGQGQRLQLVGETDTTLDTSLPVTCFGRGKFTVTKATGQRSAKQKLMSERKTTPYKSQAVWIRKDSLASLSTPVKPRYVKEVVHEEPPAASAESHQKPPSSKTTSPSSTREATRKLSSARTTSRSAIQALKSKLTRTKSLPESSASRLRPMSTSRKSLQEPLATAAQLVPRKSCIEPTTTSASPISALRKTASEPQASRSSLTSTSTKSLPDPSVTWKSPVLSKQGPLASRASPRLAARKSLPAPTSQRASTGATSHPEPITDGTPPTARTSPKPTPEKSTKQPLLPAVTYRSVSHTSPTKEQSPILTCGKSSDAHSPRSISKKSSIPVSIKSLSKSTARMSVADPATSTKRIATPPKASVTKMPSANKKSAKSMAAKTTSILSLVQSASRSSGTSSGPAMCQPSVPPLTATSVQEKIALLQKYLPPLDPPVTVPVSLNDSYYRAVRPTTTAPSERKQPMSVIAREPAHSKPRPAVMRKPVARARKSSTTGSRPSTRDQQPAAATQHPRPIMPQPTLQNQNPSGHYYQGHQPHQAAVNIPGTTLAVLPQQQPTAAIQQPGPIVNQPTIYSNPTHGAYVHQQGPYGATPAMMNYAVHPQAHSYVPQPAAYPPLMPSSYFPGCHMPLSRQMSMPALHWSETPDAFSHRQAIYQQQLNQFQNQQSQMFYLINTMNYQTQDQSRRPFNFNTCDPVMTQTCLPQMGPMYGTTAAEQPAESLFRPISADVHREVSPLTGSSDSTPKSSSPIAEETMTPNRPSCMYSHRKTDSIPPTMRLSEGIPAAPVSATDVPMKDPVVAPAIPEPARPVVTSEIPVTASEAPVFAEMIIESSATVPETAEPARPVTTSEGSVTAPEEFVFGTPERTVEESPTSPETSECARPAVTPPNIPLFAPEATMHETSDETVEKSAAVPETTSLATPDVPSEAAMSQSETSCSSASETQTANPKIQVVEAVSETTLMTEQLTVQTTTSQSAASSSLTSTDDTSIPTDLSDFNLSLFDGFDFIPGLLEAVTPPSSQNSCTSSSSSEKSRSLDTPIIKETTTVQTNLNIPISDSEELEKPLTSLASHTQGDMFEKLTTDCTKHSVVQSVPGCAPTEKKKKVRTKPSVIIVWEDFLKMPAVWGQTQPEQQLVIPGIRRGRDLLQQDKMTELPTQIFRDDSTDSSEEDSDDDVFSSNSDDSFLPRSRKRLFAAIDVDEESCEPFAIPEPKRVRSSPEEPTSMSHSTSLHFSESISNLQLASSTTSTTAVTSAAASMLATSDTAFHASVTTSTVSAMSSITTSASSTSTSAIGSLATPRLQKGIEPAWTENCSTCMKVAKILDVRPLSLMGTANSDHILTLLDNIHHYNLDFSIGEDLRISKQVIDRAGKQCQGRPHLFARNLVFLLFTVGELYQNRVKSLDAHRMKAIQSCVVTRFGIDEGFFKRKCEIFINQSIRKLYYRKLKNDVFVQLLEHTCT